MRTPIDVGVSGCVGRSPESGETSYQDRREHHKDSEGWLAAFTPDRILTDESIGVAYRGRG